MDRADVKDRGKKHLRAKTRYKGKKFTKETTQLPARQEALPSNHDRYEHSDSDEQTTGADFALLANAPTSIGGHFQFKNDALQNTQESMDSCSKHLQSLDAGLLSYSLRTIPFHIRCNIDSKYIGEKQREKLCQDAERNKGLYEEYLKCLQSQKESTDESREACEKVQQDVVAEKGLKQGKFAADPEQAELEDWLEDLLNS